MAHRIFRPYHLRSCLVLLCILMCHALHAQNISGRVIDSASNKPIPNASVYLNGSSIGTTTNQDGEFTLRARTANIPLVVSCIGYESETIIKYGNQGLIVRLAPKALVLNEVVINVGGLPRPLLMAMFLKEFLGTPADGCTISNPDDLKLSYSVKNKRLVATADKPLQIVNKRTGYKITYYLNTFYATDTTTRIRGTYFFEDDTAGLKAANIRRILKTRESYYLGSKMHFIRSLWEGDLKKNKFELYNNLFNGKELIPEQTVVSNYQNQKYFTYKGSVNIVYRGNMRQASLLRLAPGRTAGIIDSDGYYDPDLYWSGEMAEQRMAQLLPFEYRPAGELPPTVTNEPLAKKSVRDSLLWGMVDRQDSVLKHAYPEKLYLHLDKTNYILNDTIWFKAYLLNAATLRASAKSRIAYIEISDEKNVVVSRRTLIFPDSVGMTDGFIAFNNEFFVEGNYTLRAYTDWMRNFNEDYVFKRSFYIYDIDKYKWLISYQPELKNGNAKVLFQLSQADHTVIANQPVIIGAKQGSAVLINDARERTSPFGGFTASLTPRNNGSPIYATLQKADEKKPDPNAIAYEFPLQINRPEKNDLQFMPEGGHMVGGLNTVIGFKAISEDGNGTNIHGTIVNAANQPVVGFRSNYNGMGSFAYTPEANVKYTAVVDLPDGTKKNYPLPEVKPAGTVLNIINDEDRDSVIVKVSTTAANGRYILLGQSRGLICYAARLRLNSNVTQVAAPKSAFATGIVRFTLLTEDMTTLNERIVFVDKHDMLRIAIGHDKLQAGADSLRLKLEVKDGDDTPVQGSFSVSVIKSLQLNGKTDSASMLTYLLLTADLKGTVQNPQYYFGGDAGRHKALDQLMLTQGWTGYDWKSLFSPPKPMAFSAEKTMNISGSVAAMFGKAKDVQVRLFSMSPSSLKETRTDQNGNFYFNDLAVSDSTVFYANAATEKGNSRRYDIAIKGKEWPVFLNTPRAPWYVNADTNLLKTADALLKKQNDLNQLKGLGKLLNEVTIKEKKAVKGSHNLNGPGEADQVLDEVDIAKAGDLSFIELLKRQVKKFRVQGIPPNLSYFIGTEPLRFIFDGVHPRVLNLFPEEYQELLKNLKAEDVKGIEVMNTYQYASKYHREYLPASAVMYMTFAVPYIEVTTKVGINKIVARTRPTVAGYKPPVPILSKQFYQPLYRIKNNPAKALEEINTIYWEPNIVTDRYGRAEVTVYTSGRAEDYNITIEGTDQTGNIGRFTTVLKVPGVVQ